MKSNKFWIIIFGLIVAGCVVVALFLHQAPASFVSIYKDGVKVTEAVNLFAVTESFAIVVDDMAVTGSVFDGTTGRNIIEIDTGRVRMLEADCPDGYCVHQGWISGGFMPIVCLPNRVVVVPFGGSLDNNSVDAVVG